MRIVSIVSTKGGPGKTTVTANLGAFCADANLRTLLIDLDTQPSLSSFYRLDHEAPGSIYEFIAHNETRFEQIVSRTCIPNLSLILSNDPFNQLSNLLLHAADGRLRLKNLMSAFADDFDLVLIDTQGARSVMLEMALLASDMAVSPISPDMLAAREFYRGTQQLLIGGSFHFSGRLRARNPPRFLAIHRLGGKGARLSEAHRASIAYSPLEPPPGSVSVLLSTLHIKGAGRMRHNLEALSVVSPR
ncbi:ParA family protein [Pseudomonas cichorii]|nr:ParA family protein [Pseudomonas cichorii]MBX8508974.1 ParA family protein [Pseudomonas cichorii]MBX8524537.1 ParA family protein [Pseudomonas cichorii]